MSHQMYYVNLRELPPWSVESSRLRPRLAPALHQGRPGPYADEGEQLLYGAFEGMTELQGNDSVDGCTDVIYLKTTGPNGIDRPSMIVQLIRHPLFRKRVRGVAVDLPQSTILTFGTNYLRIRSYR